MARGDRQRFQQQQQQQLNQANQIAQQANQNQERLLNTVAPMYQSEYDNPGYSVGEKQAMTQATSGSLAGAFGAARDRLQNSVAQTGNSAGVNATEEELGREQGRQNAEALGNLQGQFGQARIQGQQNAMEGLGGLYGQTSTPLEAGLNAGDSLVGDQQRMATQPGFWSQVLQHGLNSLQTMGMGGGGGNRGGGGIGGGNQ